LRTTFPAADDGPVLRVAPPPPAELPVIDLRDLRGKPAAGEAARRRAAEEAGRPFDLAAGPLFRAALLRLDEEEHWLLLTLHHIVADGWSIGVLVREVGALYPAFAGGGAPGLPELPVQYGDFAAWQQGWLAGERLDRELEHWRQRLAGGPEPLELPTDRPRPRVRSSRGGSRPLDLSPEPWGAVAHLGLRLQATPFMVLLAAFAAVLQRYSGQSDLAVGTPVANRNRPEIADLIGLFVNTLVLRADLSGDPTFGELLERVRGVCLDAYAHQDVPFEKLVSELRPDRDISRQPLVQVLLALQNAPVPPLRLPDLSLARLALHNGTAKFDLALMLEEGEDGLRGDLEYSTDLFDAATAARMTRHFRVCLETAALHPGRPLSRLPLLSVAESHHLLAEWNDTARRQPPAVGGIHGRFEACAARAPQAVALSRDGESLTYAELNDRANRLAHHLRALGVGPESVVGVCLDRSLELVATLLAILKAGGAYLPLEPAYPRDRLALMLADTGASMVVSRERWLEMLPGGVHAVCLDREAAAIDACAAEDPGNRTAPEHLAYLIYTSGSLGRPKAVMIEHRSAVALLDWSESVFADEELDGVLAATSIAFDLSVFEIFVPLCRGGRVVLAGNALELPRAAAAAEVRLLNTVPSALAALLRDGGLPATVRTVNVAGEALPGSLVEAAYGQSGVRRVLNLYGPSEDTTYSTGYEVPRGAGHPPWIGRPVENTSAYVLDAAGRPAPPGILGELHLGGAGLARGYFGRPELTAERFVPDPFGPEPGGRLYRTGDLACWRAVGELDFLGRIDHQVKVRGFRIEPGEVEAALARHPAVAESVVVARRDEASDLRLVAYVAPRGEAPEWAELRAFLRRSLPEFALPSDAVFLAALPRTPNGKVDRKALPAPVRDRESGGVAPRTPLEELLAGIWCDVLRLDRIGVHDGFFNLGGHSLLGTQLFVRLRRALAVDLPLSLLFEAPTVAELAARVETMLRDGGGDQAPPVVPVPRDGELPLSFAQQRLWFLDQLEPGSAVYNMPHGVRLLGPLDVGALAGAIGGVVARHESLRTTFVEHGGRPAQRIAPVAADLPYVDLSGLQPAAGEGELRRVAEEEARRSFDLARGPLLRTLLLRLAAADHAVVLNMHHIVSDGWSLGVLLEEMAALYGAAVRGEASPLPPLPVQYADFAAWQRTWLQGDQVERLLAGWRRRLAGLPGLELPTDRPRPGVETFRGSHRPVALLPRLTAALQTLGRRRGATLFMVLLAAFETLLHRCSGQDDLSVGSPVANRNRPGLEGLIGFFANTLVLRTDLAGDPPFAELLGRAREAALAAYAGQDLPFEKLVEELRPQRDMSHNPLFQVMLVLQNQPRPALRLPGVELAPFNIDTGTAKFDLTLFLWPEGEGLGGAIEFNSDLFDPATPRRWMGHLTAILEAVAQRPETRLWDLPLLGEVERHQFAREWNDSAVPDTGELLVHRLVEAQARQTPDACAAVFGGERLTYRELNRQANRLAHHLRRLGIGPEVLVGICLERSLDMVVALLAVLKAGGGGVALDPTYPADRLAYIVRDAAMPVLLTEEKLRHGLPAAEGVRRLCVESLRTAVALEPEADLEGGATAESPMYAIYTSGSTGLPKGILVTHRAFANLLAWQLGHSSLAPRARTVQFATFGFCVSFQEIFSAWCSGGTLVVVDESRRRDMEALAEILETEEVERLHLPFAALKHLAEVAATRERLPGQLREVITAGEQLQVSTAVAALFDRLPGCWLHNQYGASETHVVSSFSLAGEPGRWPTIPPVGRPIANVEIHLLDPHLRPAPVGVPAELCAGGACMPRCYLGDPEMTAGKMIPNPFSLQPGERLYRTGDLARLRADGQIEHLGRIDGQVKIRGFRVEVGEIDALLERHPAVRDAAVVAQATGGDGKRLVAYVVLAAGGGPEVVEELRLHLKQKLPEYMLPAAWVVLAALPLNANGKLDRAALPLPDAARGLATRYVAPRDPVEEVLAEIWMQVLEVDRVGVHDGFFELGGHSLLATQLVSRVRTAFRIELPLRTLFEATTVADLAQALVDREAAPGRTEKIARLYQRVRRLDAEAVRTRLQAAGGSGPA
jgi:amino acid adenylation domain-containing protein